MSEESKGLMCPITGCPMKKIAIATVIVFIVSFIYDWLVHGMLLHADYEATAALWRPMAEMQGLMKYAILYHAVLAFGTAALYCYSMKSADCGGACRGKGLRFGLLLGIIIGISHFSAFIMLPMPLSLAVKWFVAGLGWGLVQGFALSCACRCGCSKPA
jgi:hypothetical protein